MSAISSNESVALAKQNGNISLPLKEGRICSKGTLKIMGKIARPLAYGCWYSTGSKPLTSSQALETKAQLLGFLLYGTPPFIVALLEAFGSEIALASPATIEELLPGPHPVLRCLISSEAGDSCCCVPMNMQRDYKQVPSA